MSFFKLNDNRLLASVDLGSYLIKCTVFEKSDKLPLKILSSTEQKTSGLENSRIIDFQSFTLALSEVLSRAEELSGSSFSEVWLGFSPPFHFRKSYGMVALPNKEVLKPDLDLAIQTAMAVPLPDQHISLHQRPEVFYVDSKQEITNPLGLSGLRLEVQIGLFNVLDSYKNSFHKALKTIGYKPRSFSHNIMSFGEHFTSLEEKQNGVCVCDIGHSETRVISYHKNKIQNLFSIPMGGKQLTQALVDEFRLTFNQAEELKHQEARLLCHSPIESEALEYSQTGVYISRKKLSLCLESVFAKLLAEIKKSIPHKEKTEFIKSFIFTGASSYIKGFLEFAELNLGRSVSHKNLFYKNFQDNQNLTLLQQAYLENKLEQEVPKTNSLHFIRELF